MSLSPYWLLLLTVLLPLPFSTDRRGRRTPWVTYTLIALNVLVYCFTGPTTYERWGLIPNAPHFIALLTGIFIHVSLAHIFWNMMFLWLFGPHVEEALGWEAFLALYLGGGIAAGLLHMAIILLYAPKVVVPLVGASGAISAILAPFAIRFHRAQIRMFWLPGALFGSSWGQLEVPAVAGVVVWMLQNIGGGVYFIINPQPGGTAYWAHIGGFVFGLIAAELTGLLRDGRQDYLLQDARSAGARGHESLDLAIKKYRAFLDRDPNNGLVRLELAHLLAAPDEPEAVREMLGAVRVFLKRDQFPQAARCVGDAQALGLPLPLTPRERLRLAGTLEATGETDTAIALLNALLQETPDSPEDEMARLKLGQLLRERDPARANDVLDSFLTKYPHSQWAHRAREMQTNV
ncbi:MAG: rhomboid family intramembrane serine protease [Janthinobacterium lividum]